MTTTQYEITFRPPVPTDRDLTFAWNQVNEVTKYLPSMPKPLSWEAHRQWWDKVWDRAKKGGIPTREDFMITVAPYRPDGGMAVTDPMRRTVGRVHAADLQSQHPEVGVLIGCLDVWGNGIGTAAIEFIGAWLDERGCKESVALVRPENAASLKLFARCGFEDTMSYGRGGQVTLVRKAQRWVHHPHVETVQEGHRHEVPDGLKVGDLLFAYQCSCGLWFRHDGLVRYDPMSWVWEKP